MVRVWRASDLTLLRVLRGHRGAVLCLVALGNLLLSGARDNAIRWVCCSSMLSVASGGSCRSGCGSSWAFCELSRYDEGYMHGCTIWHQGTMRI
jgi:hypothetical protein